jgi:DNA-binding transcriptional LysR family regulator
LLSPFLYDDLLSQGALIAPFEWMVDGPDRYWVLWHRDAPAPHFVRWLQQELAQTRAASP